ncbi:MAG: endolytic transglycosylase MltG [Bacteroidales bacterium]|nr:endolytic transglycosylase MltG [Bacteroidales bacterium]
MKKYLLSVLAMLLVAGGLFAYNWLRDNRMSNFNESFELYVRPETCSDDVLQMVAGTVMNARRLKKVFREKEVDTYLKPGHYLVRASCSSVELARRLNNGWQTPVRLTLSGALRKKTEIAGKIGAQMLVDSAAVLAALQDPVFLRPFGYTPETVFSMFVPDTYEMYWTATLEEIFQRQKKASDAYWTPARVEQARQVGLSREEACILASIVRGESRYEPELPKIAGVYLNRLAIGMKLQADPTIAFCYDYEPHRILRAHLGHPSAYNTYQNKGLPPGPICVPAPAYIEAVLHPDYGTDSGKAGRNGNLYFCANSDFSGSHVFAKTYTEHQKNARKFQKALNNRK